jgi:TusA-related sulfurtransferase
MSHQRERPGVEATEAPPERPREYLDVRDLPPPEPLTETLELLAESDRETVVVQTNDRAPQHLYPKLSERGYEYDTVETEESVVTAIWQE